MSKPYNEPCKICGSTNQLLFDDDDDRTSIFCQSCKNYEDIYVSEELQKYWDEQDELEEIKQQSTKPTVTCPYCQSTNTKKISNTSKAMSVGLFGIFGMSKVNKQWHCNNCKSDF